MNVKDLSQNVSHKRRNVTGKMIVGMAMMSLHVVIMATDYRGQVRYPII